MEHGYLASSRPNRTKQAILLIAYIGIVALTLLAALPAGVGASTESWVVTAQPEAVQFAPVSPAVADADLQTLTRADFTAGLRAMHRGGLYHAAGLAQVAKHSGGYRTFPTIVDQMSTILRKHGAWSTEEIQTLKEVLAEQYPHIVIH